MGTWPPIPYTAARVTRFLFYINISRNLSGGWNQALSWHRAVVRWLAPIQRDPFVAVDTAFYEHVRAAFRATVTQRRFPKAPVTEELFASIWDHLGSGSELHETERTLFLLFYVTGFRVASLVLGSDRRGPRRIIRLRHVSFFQGRDGHRHAFIVLPMTKTTEEWRPVGHVVRPRPDGDASRCAVSRLYDYIQHRRKHHATPSDPVFVNPRNRRAYSRNVLAAHLKTYVDCVASRVVLGHRLPKLPSAYISGISFRRGTLTRLANAGVHPTLIARYAHHKSIDAQMAYVCETYEAPGVSASAVYGRF